MSVQGNPYIIPDSLLLYYDVGHIKSYPKSGNTVYDLSGNGRNATLYNVSYDASNVGSFSFNGYNSYAIASATGIASVMASKTTFTISIWANLSTYSYGNNRILFASANNHIIVDAYIPYISFYTNYGGTYTGANVVPNTNTWYNITCTYAGPYKYLYINGVISGTRQNIGSAYNGTYFFSNDTIYLGTIHGGGAYFFPGKISSVSIYSRELNQSEIQQNYNAYKSRYEL